MADTQSITPSLLPLLPLLLTSISPASGTLHLQVPPRPPRVYAGAPSGVAVTRVRAVDDHHNNDQQTVRYSLYESPVTDYKYFTIDEYGGNITTARYLERLVGEQYRVIVVAMMSGNANNTELTIFVTHYNQYDPRLSLQHYSAEVLVGSKVGAPLVSVEGADDDAVHYNRRLRYFLADPNVHFYLDPFLEPPRWSPVAVDQDSGGVSVSGDLRLNTSPLQLLVGVVDAGSPQRYSLANLTIYVRNISAPRGVKVVHTTESTLKVCWSPPTHGRPQGYVLTYTPSLAHSNYGQGSLNLSISQLRSKIIGGSSREEEAVGENEGVVGGVAGGVVEIYRYCAIVGGLARWTEYIVGVRAWAVEQVSIAAVPVLATTRSDYCGEGVCGTGGCTLRQSTPGYICHCQPGYYGLNCQHHNPCLPHNPCQHFGKCQNVTDGSYTCDCPRGFYGDNCTHINPCEAVTSNPCNNGGTCVRMYSNTRYTAREESGRYRCVCTEGFYGMTCEHYDPCVSSPCQHGGSCTNLSHTTFSCHCAPGYRGKLCQAEVNECFPSPCARGHCVDLVNDYYCQCPQGWGGKLCGEDLDECASYPCMNGATCIDGVASFVCDCAYGYNGEHCDIPESCPAQHTLLDAGDFYWPATQHGTSVTLACPFGVRASARDNISTGNTTTLPGPTPPPSPPPTTTKIPVTTNMMSRKYEDGSPRSTPAPLSLSSTTHAQWKGGSFRISRRTRNVEIPASAYNTSPSSPVSEVNDHDARRRLIVSNLRASHPRDGRGRKQQQQQEDKEKEQQENEQQQQQQEKGKEEKEEDKEKDQENEQQEKHQQQEQQQQQQQEDRPGWLVQQTTREPDPQSHVDQHQSQRTTESPDGVRGSTDGVRGSTDGVRGSTDGVRGSADGATESPDGVRGSTDGVRGSTDGVRGSENGATESTDGATESADGARGSADGARGSADGARGSADGARGSADGARGSADGARGSADGATESADGARGSADGARGSADGARGSADGARGSADGARGSADGARGSGDRLSRQENRSNRPIAEPRIGEGEAGREHKVATQSVRVRTEAPEADEGRAASVREKNYYQQEIDHRIPQVKENLSDKLTAYVNNFEQQNNGEQLRINGTILSQIASSRREDLPQYLPSDDELLRHSEIGEQLPSRTVRTSVGSPQFTKSHNEKIKVMEPQYSGATRSCVLLPNGTVVWQETDTSVCRGKAMKAAEDAAKSVANLTSSPATISPLMLTRAAHQLSALVEHALQDPAVASNMVSALSNLLDVNDSVVAEGEKTSNVTTHLVNTINSLVQNIPVEVGHSVDFRSTNLVLEARLVDAAAATDNITFTPLPTDDHDSRHKRSMESSLTQELFLRLPPQVLSKAGQDHVRLEFVSYSNDKFFRDDRGDGMPVITARVTNTVVTNLTQPVVYHIPAGEHHLPLCVYWDDLNHEWSEVGMTTVTVGSMTTCQATHLTAFSILLDPLPSSFGIHGQALSIITYIGLALSTAGLTATVATYALFRTLNRDRSGKIVMNLSLALLLLNLLFIVAAQLKPPSPACTVLAAALHYLVIAAFAWMLVEAANMYQLLITVFASAETNFMAKRVFAAWGAPIVVVAAALIADLDVYGDESHGFCVISPRPNPAVYYSTYMGPICCVLMVNCIVFVMVTRVVCGRRPRSHKPRSPSTTPSKESPITLAQVRGAVTVVALLGVTWVAGAVSVGWARITLQYIFCVTTPLQGVIIFVVRVAQHPEARAAWITLFTTGTLRRRPPTTHTHSTHSSAHTSSSALTPPRNNHSSLRSISTKISPRTSVKRPSSVKRNGSTAYSKNGSDHRYSMGTSRTTMSTLFSRLVHCFSNSGLELDKTRPQEEIVINSPTKPGPTEATPPQRHASSPRQESFFSETLQEKSLHSNKNGTLYRPQSLIMLRPENRGFVSVNQPSNSKDCNVDQFPGFLSSNIMSQDLPEAAMPQSLIPGRSLGSLMLLTEGKEGDDSSWHFVRPPPDGRSDPVNEEEEKVLEATDQIIPLAHVEHKDSMNPVIESVRTEAALRSGDCVVLAGQRVATKHSIMFSGQGKGSQWAGTLIRANSEGQVGSPHISPSDLRRSASVFTLGEWEDPRSSLA